MTAAARYRMTDTLLAQGALAAGSCWADAFATVPRETFVPVFTLRTVNGDKRVFEPGGEGYDEAVYTDTTLVTCWDAAGTPVSSSSQPSLMARMLEAFTVPDAARVLEIGTGTGYNTALLCHRLGAEHVVSVDIDPELTAQARDRLRAAGYTPLMVTGDGTKGHADAAPYDGILATCGVDRIPTAWLAQVKPGGIIVTNVGNGVVRLTVREDGGAEGAFLPEEAAFMRARPAPDHVAARAGQFAGLVMGGSGASTTVRLPVPADEASTFLGELVQATAMEIWMLHHDVLSMTLGDPEDGELVHGLVHPATGSWARITPALGTDVTVEHGGPRDLFGERLALMEQWAVAGRPQPGAYTLTVTAEGLHTLYRAEPATARLMLSA
ncbi:methyltransferase domain-containing protein [Streptomyces albireticuli]|uniref:methyltransferase domain-containing protein n=1 Tax=Streptomyces albireticuli TaxID=1940 RepID=UPI001E5EBE74|nr:methyltransferase domain-containing protein [Streptomyces albireticuli]MCD9146116.1 methyltransferase domain-containing protein [Streptomyces albireticuli]